MVTCMAYMCGQKRVSLGKLVCHDFFRLVAQVRKSERKGGRGVWICFLLSVVQSCLDILNMDITDIEYNEGILVSDRTLF